ncbi:sugar phosphate isomerase/epimerase family protein [Peribacillus muralis]|uniref:sugar phosphate isomerase/epimerase family protein n=1 Tax=Peribacillus muralis TaxID=264697 RepID=UPI00366E37B3
MELRVLKSLWGMTEPLHEQFKKVKDAGFSGIESPLPREEEENQFKELLEEYEFDYIVQVGTRGNYIASFEAQVERATKFNPILINSHSAKDDMKYDEQLFFFEKAVQIEKAVNIPVSHETHRGRAMFTPWATARLLKDIKELKITADFSHWCCVCESMLEDQLGNITLAIQRAIHIHARVGYTGGPQVPDPSAPEYKNELRVHEDWWKQICLKRQREGASFFTVTPEFGPPSYMHTLPHTNQPVIDLWEVNDWMKKRLNEQFEAFEFNKIKQKS